MDNPTPATLITLRVSSLCRSSPMEEDLVQTEDVIMQGHLELPSSNMEAIDVVVEQPHQGLSNDNAQHQEGPSTDEEVAVVLSQVGGVKVINLNDVESGDFNHRMVGDSIDADSDEDDKSVDYGVVVPVASAVSIEATPLSTPPMDEFYNAARKASHPERIVPKQESN